MKKMTKLAGMAAAAFLLAGCQNTENDATEQEVEPPAENSQNESDSSDNDATETEDTGEENMNNGESEEESTDDTAEDESVAYEETQVTPDYFIDSYVYSAETEFLTAFTIRRDEDQDFSREERLQMSLIENDPSEQEILGSFTELAAEGPTLLVNFNVEGNQLSTTSAQSGMFFDSLFGISDLYGIEEITFFNPDGEEEIIVAERMVDKPIIIEEERSLSLGYYTIYDRDSSQTYFLPAGKLEEQVENGDGEPLSFPEALESMRTVESEDAFYSSAIVEGLEIVDASLENGIATVHYTMDDELATENDRIVFENAMQLTAIDFDASEVRLMNESLQETTIYPLLGQ